MEKNTPHLTIPNLAELVPDEASAYRLLEELRWGDEPRCPHCDSDRKPYYLKAKGEGRKTRTGKVSPRRVWKCAECRKQFSVLTGTIFHGTKVPIRTWLFVIVEMCAAKNGISAREIERKYGLTPKTAWYMTQRIREAMRRDPVASLLQGTIVADETWIGGKSRRRGGTLQSENDKESPRKSIVLTLIDREDGESRSQVIPDVTSDSLYRAVLGSVDPDDSRLFTDEHRGYNDVGSFFEDGHQKVWHSGGEYVRGEVTTNPAESFFSQLKRSIAGTFHHVSHEHLHRYLAEFDFRYSTRKLSDTERVARLIGQVDGRRLAYKPLAGN